MSAGNGNSISGEVGFGKSTIAHLIPRFYDVQQSSMSLVFQDIVLLGDTVRENIRIANPNATNEAILKAMKAAYIHDDIEQLPYGYDTVLGAGNIGLSVGEKQRLTIARAMLSDAPIVVLDEATALLNPDNEALLQQALSSLVKNKTVIMIAHRLYIISNAHQIIVLAKGKIAEKGTHQQLLNNQSLYTKMWEAQII